MTLEQIGILVGIIVAILGIVGGIAAFFSRITKLETSVEALKETVDNLEDKIDSIWGFILNRGIVEAVTVGIAKMNSPMIILPEVREWFVPLKDDLQNFYKTHKYLTDNQLALAIEKRWGQDILEKICIPHKILHGACLLIAVDVAKGE